MSYKKLNINSAYLYFTAARYFYSFSKYVKTIYIVFIALAILKISLLSLRIPQDNQEQT